MVSMQFMSAGLALLAFIAIQGPELTKTSTILPTTRILIIGGKNDSQVSNRIYEFNPEVPSMQLFDTKTLRFPIDIMEAHALGNKIIVQGGRRGHNLGETWLVTMVSNILTLVDDPDSIPGPSDFIGHFRGCSGVNRGIFYACSGKGASLKNPTCTSFDPSTNVTQTFSLPKWFRYGACAIEDSKLYYSGGRRSDASVGYILSLPSGSLDATIPDIPYIMNMSSTRIRDVPGVWYQGKFTVCGGRDDQAKPNAYTKKCHQLQEGNWVDFPSLTEPKCDFKMTVWGNKLLAIGGRVDKDALNTIEVYDSAVGEWHKIYNMPEDLFGSAIINLGQ